MAGDNAAALNFTIKDSEPDPGGAFRQSFPVPTLGGLLVTTDITAADPGSSGFIGVKMLHGTTTAYKYPWVLPEEYDHIADELDVVLIVQRSGATDTTATLTLSLLQVVAPIAVGEKDVAKPVPATAQVGVASAAVTSTTGAITPSTALTPQELVTRFSAKGLHPKDPITLLITPGTHATDDWYILGITFLPKCNAAQTYRSRRYFKDVKA